MVVALDDPDKATLMVQYARRERPDLHIVARARDRNHVFALYQAGANDIVRELFDSSLRAGRYALENLGLTDYEAAAAEQAFYQHDRHTLLELAQVWRHDVPAHENDAYISRAKSWNKSSRQAFWRHWTKPAKTAHKKAAQGYARLDKVGIICVAYAARDTNTSPTRFAAAASSPSATAATSRVKRSRAASYN